MKNLIIFLFLLSGNAFAESMFNMDSIRNFFEASEQQNQNREQKKYQFIKSTKPSDPKGIFTMNCFFDNGTPVPGLSSIPVASLKINIVNYEIVTPMNKRIKVPINHCFLIEN